MDLKTLLMVFCGAGVGGVLRHLIAAPINSDKLPLGTLLVNLSGCLAIGVLSGIFAGSARVPEEWRVALTVGLLGGYTTFSAFGRETLSMIDSGRWGTAIAYALGSTVMGVAAVGRGSGPGSVMLQQSGVNDASRYSRQAVFPGIDPQGQERLAASHALIVGVGALGVCADLLARAGVGTLTLIDRDVVEESNLHRQSLFEEEDAAQLRPKAVAAARRVARVNSTTRVHARVADFTASVARSMLGPSAPDVILDGTDNFETRYVLNDLAVASGVALIYAGVIGASGVQMSILAGGACLRCVFPDAPAPGVTPTCESAGVIGPAVSAVASLQAADAMKVLVGAPIAPWLNSFDLWAGTHRRVDLSKARRADCPCCGLRRFEWLEADDNSQAVLCGQNAVQVTPAGAGPGRIDLGAVAARLGGAAEVSRGTGVLRVRPSPGVEITLFADARAIIRGAANPAQARGIYDRWIGA